MRDPKLTEIDTRVRRLASDAVFAAREEAGEDVYPATYGPAPPETKIFDPSTKHYPMAFRPPDPALEDPTVLAAWRQASREAMQHVLAHVARTRFRERLVLRGSTALAWWFGARAREPKDLDFVVQPSSFSIEDPEARALESAIVEAIASDPRVGEVFFFPGDTVRSAAPRRSRLPCAFIRKLFSVGSEWLRATSLVRGTEPSSHRVETDYIWTYDRVPGRRIALPWKKTGLPAGSVQIDLVFSETLFTEPRTELVTVTGGDPAPVRVATPEESLVWKILWLVTDTYPQGKDLYDAALLRERTAVDPVLIAKVFALMAPSTARAPASDGADWRERIAAQTMVDWANFVAEHPALAASSTLEELRRRLAAE
jgi:hypothetical protein